MNEAEAAAWNLYVTRVQTLVSEQHDEFAVGKPTGRITIVPPTREHVEIIQGAIDRAVKAAKAEVFRAALDPMRRAIDAIDHSRSKSETVKECRADIQIAYDALHALWRSESPQARRRGNALR